MHGANCNGVTAGHDHPAETIKKNATETIAIFTEKAIATQIARLALAGHTVHKGKAGDYTVCKHGMSRYCKDFAELQAFARLLGVNK